jgi:hypothetical protein
VSELPTSGSPGGAPAPGRSALDLFVFAPVGLVATVVEELPHLIDKGRERLGLQVRNARFVGQLVVTSGRERLRRQAGFVRVDDAGSIAPASTRSGQAPDEVIGLQL